MSTCILQTDHIALPYIFKAGKSSTAGKSWT